MAWSDAMGLVTDLATKGQYEDERLKALNYLLKSGYELNDLEGALPGDPALEGAPERVGGSQMDSPEAQAMRQQQLRALSRLQRVSDEGYTDTDRAAMNDALSEVNQQERGNRLAIQQRLGGNNGASIAAQLANNQAAAQRANQQGLQVAGAGRARALRALGDYGAMAGGMRGQEMQVGAANDAIARFNAANSMEAGSRNANRSNQAAQQGFMNRAGITAMRGRLNNQMADRHDEEGVNDVAYGNRIGRGIGGIVDSASSSGGGGSGGGGGGGFDFSSLIKMFGSK